MSDDSQAREVRIIASDSPQLDWSNLAAIDNSAGLEWLKARFGSLCIRNPLDKEGQAKPPIDVSQLKLLERIPANHKSWGISIYSDASQDKVLVTSPGEHLFGTVEDILAQRENNKVKQPRIAGTYVKQGWETAHEMTRLALKEYHWPAIEVVHELTTSIRMSFAVCHATLNVHGLQQTALRGYDVLPEDIHMMQLIKAMREGTLPRPTL